MSAAFELSEECLAVLRSLPFGVYVCDRNCIVRYINDAYAAYLGKSPEEVAGHSIYEFLEHSRARQVMRSRRSELYDESSVRPEMTNERILVNRIPLINAEDEVFGYISQVMSIGDHGWTDILGRLNVAGHALRKFQFTTSGEGGSADERHEIIGASSVIRERIDRAELYAATDEAVMIVGPTGVGKELFAHAVHRGSRRADKPLISLNCATLSREFINSELFGYAPGAFTGASRNGKMGLMELADGGTLFLDEIGELPLEVQGSLLRALETHTIQRVNDLHPRKVDFRLISATNCDLPAMVEKKLFRADLYYRISVLSIDIPPLASRREDIALLVRHFLEHLPVPDVSIDEECLDVLMRYDWPGNVRELRNAVICAAVNSGYGRIVRRHLPSFLLEEKSTPTAMQEAGSLSPTHAGEREIIREALCRSGGNMARTARELRMSRTTLYKKVAAYGLSAPFDKQ